MSEWLDNIFKRFLNFSGCSRTDDPVKKRLMVILGAGASIELGYPSTDQLTGLFRNSKNIRIIEDALDRLDSRINLNFEDIFHLTHTLYRICYMKGIAAAENPFYDLHKKQLNTIYSEILNAEKRVEDTIKNNKNYWYKVFWKSLSEKYNLNIISLNYDALFEDNDLLKGNLVTGFTGKNFGGIIEFDRQEFEENYLHNHSIIRLHGCIKFITGNDIGYTVGNLTGTDYYWKRHLYSTSKSRVFSNSNSSYVPAPREHSYHNDGKLYTTIITGHTKTEAMHIEPYKTYYEMVAKFIDSADQLLMIGYNQNENDKHFNQFIEKFKGKIIEVNYNADRKGNTHPIDSGNRKKFECGFKKFTEINFLEYLK